MRTLTYREYLGQLVRLNGGMYFNQGRYDRAIAYFERAAALDPKSAVIAADLSMAHRTLAFLTEGKESLSHFDMSRRFGQMAQERGFVAMRDTPAWGQMWRKIPS
jgi:tetratricopeptide (TPR) repeat protein